MNYFPPDADEDVARGHFSFVLLFILIATLFAVFSCGKAGKVGNDSPTPPPDFAAKLTLVLFGAPPCSNCHRDFPEIQRLLDQVAALDKEGLDVVVYVETGTAWTSPPGAYVAREYVKSIGVRFEARADGVRKGKPSYEIFTRLTGIPLESAGLPAAVLVRAGGEVLTRFEPGGTTFVPQLIVQKAIETLRTVR